VSQQEKFPLHLLNVHRNEVIMDRLIGENMHVCLNVCVQEIPTKYGTQRKDQLVEA
jgi:hypothetical protein